MGPALAADEAAMESKQSKREGCSALRVLKAEQLGGATKKRP